MLEAEVDAHRRISTRAVPALRDVVHDDETGQVHLVFDYGGAPIFDVIDRSCTQEGAAHNTAVAAHATATLLLALHHLHEAGYSYNDMKPQQLLWAASLKARDFPVKLTDFGAGGSGNARAACAWWGCERPRTLCMHACRRIGSADGPGRWAFPGQRLGFVRQLGGRKYGCD
jgi:serine/threonine protein kinase